MTTSRHRLSYPALIFVVALVLRLLHLLAFRRLAFHRLPFGDARTFVEEAERIRSVGVLSGDLPWFQGPLYPLALAGLRSILGLPPESAYWVQGITGSLSAVLVYVLATRLTSPRGALVAGLLYALYDAAIFFDVDLLAISGVTTLVLAGLCLLTWQRTPASAAGKNGRRGIPLTQAAAGICLGLAAWGRPNLTLPLVIVMVAVIVEWVRTRTPKGSRVTGPGMRPWPFVAAAAITLLLPLARNLATSGEPIFISSGGGVNFYIGNHRGAPGTFRIPPESGLSNDLELARIAHVVASQAEGRVLTPGETSRYWFGRGWSDLTADPGTAVALYGRKALLLVNRMEIPNHLDLDFLRGYSAVLRLTPIRSFVLIALGVGGLVLVRRRREARWIILYAVFAGVSVLPFFVTARYRLPMMALLAVLAGPFVDAWIDRLRRRQATAGLGAATGAAAVALAVSWLPLIPRSNHAAAHVNLGALHAELGETDAAGEELERALAADPRDARAMENLGMIALQTGRLEEALGWVERSLAVDARSVSAWNLRGAALGRLERYDEAIGSFQRALDIRPGEPSATQNLSYTWQRYLAHCRAIAVELGLEDLSEPGTTDRLAAELEALGYGLAARRLRGEDRPPSSTR